MYSAVYSDKTFAKRLTFRGELCYYISRSHCNKRKCWNRQTGTFEVRVSMTCGFKSHLPHQLKERRNVCSYALLLCMNTLLNTHERMKCKNSRYSATSPHFSSVRLQAASRACSTSALWSSNCIFTLQLILNPWYIIGETVESL